jgi:hypothetical protein
MNKVNIKLGETLIEFRFGLGFMGQLLESLDCSIDEVMTRLQKNPFKLIPTMMYESHNYSCYRNGEEVKYTEINFLEMLEESGGLASDGFGLFIKAFTDSMSKDVPKSKTTQKATRSKVKAIRPKK